MQDKGHTRDNSLATTRANTGQPDDFVLEKSIFSNIFEKDIQRVFIYKKAERLAKAIHLITPAFASSASLRDKLDSIAVGLVDAAISPPGSSRGAFSRELLALSSVLAIARASGRLSPMNASMITSEAHSLLAEVAAYEEPRLFLDESPTLAELAKSAGKSHPLQGGRRGSIRQGIQAAPTKQGEPGRKDAILSVIKDKGTVYIKDISTIIRDVSEKTIQRELRRLVEEGVVKKAGNRRWTAYSLI